MKVIFVSGPYRANNLQGVLANIRKARKVSLKLWLEGWAAICCHSNTALFDGAAPDNIWLEGDLEILRRCDAIYMIDGWENSEGAISEFKLAQELGLEIIYEYNL